MDSRVPYWGLPDPYTQADFYENVPTKRLVAFVFDWIIIGVITASGQPIAFQRSKAFLALKRGQDIAYENINLVIDAGGVKAVDVNGAPLGSHQAFWFAWSQFHPDTALWPG